MMIRSSKCLSRDPGAAGSRYRHTYNSGGRTCRVDGRAKDGPFEARQAMHRTTTPNWSALKNQASTTFDRSKANSESRIATDDPSCFRPVHTVDY